MRSALVAAAQRRAVRARSSSLSTVPPAEDSHDYLPELAAAAAAILYRSPLPSREGRPIYILNAAAFPDAFDVDYDSLLSYVLARLPGEDELIAGTEYEIVFFAGGQADNATSEKKQGPNTGWYLQAYHVLSRATRKKLQRLYIVHPRTWVRVLISVFGTIVSPKFRRKIVHVNSLSSLAAHVELDKLLIPPSAYLQDRKVCATIDLPDFYGSLAFGTKHPFPKNITTGKTRLPRVLRETTSFILMPANVKTEGLFRIPPHSVSSGILKEAYDRGQRFIIWKELGATFTPPGIDSSLVGEIRLEDAYGLHLAASLIKAWYRELRGPIFPENSYETLRQRFGDARRAVTPDDLVDVLYPESQLSPLKPVAREILIRHLLPMLSAVSLHAADNKMNAENLAICFSMCLLSGSDQMEDGRMSPVIRRFLHAAIEAWPQICAGMNIDSNAFYADLQPPSDYRDYEDPLPDEGSGMLEFADGFNSHDSHRIFMQDGDSPDYAPKAESRGPVVPPRKPRVLQSKDSATPPLSTARPEAPPVLPKRKPAPPVPVVTSSSAMTQTAAQPDVVRRPGRKFISQIDSASVDNGVPTSSPEQMFASKPDDLINSIVPNAASESLPLPTMPKRKAVGSHGTPGELDGPSKTSPTADMPDPAALLARLAAAHASSADLPKRTPSGGITTYASDISSSPVDDTSSLPVTPVFDGVFRKPSWPASQPPPGTSGSRAPASIQSLTKPVHAQTIPIIKHPGALPAEIVTGAPVPRPRTPSAGLLKRMASMETLQHQQHSIDPAIPTAAQERALEPRRLNLRKASVDDLRRIYEERATTVTSLATAARRKSEAAIGA